MKKAPSAPSTDATVKAPITRSPAGDPDGLPSAPAEEPPAGGTGGVRPAVRLGFSMPGDLECLAVLDGLLAGISERMGFDEETRDAVSMSVIEAGTNAIQHGCAMDASRTIDFVFDLLSDRLVVSVRDPGAGFDPSLLPTEILPEDLFRERGRGIYIIRSLMDRVEFDMSPGVGTTIRMTKLGPSGNGDGNPR